MAVRLKHRTPRDEAEEIANANYGAMMEEILRSVNGRLRVEGIKTLNRQDLEVAYNEGWQGVTQHIVQGRPLTSLAGLLFTMVHRRAIDIYRAKQEGRRVEMDLEQQAVDADLADRADDHEKLTRLLGRLKDRLNDKERRAVTLCVLHGYKRPEAADLLGIDRVVFERIMDGATKKMAGVVASIEARGCGGDEWSRLMRAYALGLLSEDEPDYQRAQAHVDGPDPCEACCRYVRGLRGLAAVLPPLLPPGLLEGHDAGSVLAHLSRWLCGGHATATLQGAGAAGATASGVAVGGGTKALLLAGAAALSVAGTAAVVATNHFNDSHGHRVAHVHRAPASIDLGALTLKASLAVTSRQPRARTVWRRGRAATEFVSSHPSPAAKENRKLEFSWEHQPASAPPPLAHTARHSASPQGGSEEEDAEFSFERK
ncbi:MAG TPA: sigma-70 family RNA polymerase sigma factor [Solirubrobacteraceae bacterium]|nr:sigma-70 family RNA polymerase sigma factor [Solirubrobacteraceae bacterium]